MTNARRVWTTDDVEALRAATGVRIGAPLDREDAERDFGRLVKKPAAGVALPRSIDEIERVIVFANERGLALTPRGRGMSQGGQSLAWAGMSLDLSRVNEIEAPDLEARTMRCGAGVTWREAIARAAPQGLMPKVVPLNLDLTVGGLLSVAGIGATSHAYGAAVSCVAEIEAVTGGGARVVASEQRERDVFRAALGGLGRAAIVGAARVELRPVKPLTRTFYLLFDSMSAWIDAQRALIAARRADYLEAFCSPCVQGMRTTPRGRAAFAAWFYGLHVTIEHAPGEAPSEDRALGKIDGARLLHIEDSTTLAFAARYDVRFSAMRRTGAWELPHPWVEAMLPGPKLLDILRTIVDLYPVGLGDGPRLLFVDRRRAPPFFCMPDDEEVACCALLPVGVPPHLVPETLEAFRAIHREIVASGGKRFLSGWITMMDEQALRAHYGDRWSALEAARRALDPRGVLSCPLTEHLSD